MKYSKQNHVQFWHIPSIQTTIARFSLVLSYMLSLIVNGFFSVSKVG